MYPSNATRLISRIAHYRTIFALTALVVTTLLFVPCSQAVDSPAKPYAGRSIKAGIYNFKPLVYTDTDGTPQGFFVKMLNHVAKKNNWNVQYLPGTWQENMDRLKSGQIDILLCIGYTEERAKFLDFPKEYLVMDWGTIYRAKGSSINSVLDLEGKTVSALKGSVYLSGFQELVKQFHLNVNILEMNQLTDVFKAVDSGKAHAGATANILGILTEVGHKVERTSIVFTPVKLGYGVNRGKNGDLVAALDSEMAALKADRTSIYYHELNHILGKGPDSIPIEAYFILLGVISALLLAVALNIILKRQVKAKTKHLEAEIFERKQTEEALKAQQSETNTLRELMDSVPGFGFAKDINLTYVTANRTFCDLLKIPYDQIKGKTDYDIFPTDLAEKYIADDKRVIETGEPLLAEEITVDANNNRHFVVATRKLPWLDKDSNVCGLYGMGFDISELKQAEDTLRRSKNMLKRTEGIAHVGSWEWDVVTDTVTWSEELYRIHQLNPADPAPSLEAQSKLYHHEDMAKLVHVVGIALSQGTPYEIELRAIRQDGETRYCLARGFTEKDSGGVVVGLYGSLQDITERKNAEAALIKSEERYKLLFNSSSDAFYVHGGPENGLPGKFIEVNDTACEMLGYSSEELIQMRPTDIDAPETIADVPVMMDNLLADKFAKWEGVHVGKDGRRIPVEITNHLFELEGKSMILSVARDITERKRSEKILAEQADFNLRVFNSSEANLAVVDQDGVILSINESWRSFAKDNLAKDESTWGVGANYFVDYDENWGDVEQALASFAGVRKVQSGELPYFNLEYSCHGPGNEKRWFLLNVLPLIGKKGSVLVSHTNITKRKIAEEDKLELERQLQHSQKLESLGVLSGGIAHDFNNILAVIMGYCSLTKLNYGMAEKNIPIIEDAAERAAGLCRQMLAYAGKAQLTKTKINMVDKVDEIVGMLKATLPQNAVIKTDLSARIPLIEGDPSQLGQVVMNLIINSSEAIGSEQGVVDVSLARIKVLAGKAYEDYHGKPITHGEYVCLEVTDNGCGMDDAAKWRIFEPFYTTKFTGRGLGMSAVLGIIKSHNGALQLFSQLGYGTTFKVYLPVPISEINGEENQIESTSPASWQGSGTILLVEDEDQVRDIAKELLEILGFTVIEAVHGKEALDLYQKNAKEITLVLTDMGMPVMDGYELFHKLKSLNPVLPIIVSSGYGDVEVSSRIGSDNIAGTISKPYNPSQLREVLQSALEGALIMR